ncbi:hypothetical protein CEF21_21380 [Bacillus sp. FJAT-42376]|uniref:hypothetical protein n=1 Tax=Bacillus sp. FJAT-42376 TaxID=2014076 RepID=UPI000F4D33C9|nr:hypothetical protein [Bacillus sp. FJAT-42376]AZB44635.1 hypothetical protein CEF21_21380 [Bacillus sp. FJAT-42376]
MKIKNALVATGLSLGLLGSTYAVTEVISPNVAQAKSVKTIAVNTVQINTKGIENFYSRTFTVRKGMWLYVDSSKMQGYPDVYIYQQNKYSDKLVWKKTIPDGNASGMYAQFGKLKQRVYVKPGNYYMGLKNSMKGTRAQATVKLKLQSY